MAAGDVSVSLSQPSSIPCAKFDGINDYVALPLGTFPTTSMNFSISLRFKLVADLADATSTSLLTFRTNSLRGIGLQLQNPGGANPTRAEFHIRNDSSDQAVSDTTNTFTVGTWYHICGTYNSSTNTMTMYTNGTAVGTNTGVVINSARLDAQIQRNASIAGTTALLACMIRDVRIWHNKELSASEVTILSVGGSIKEHLFAQYKLDVNVLDTAGNSLNGTNNGGVTFIIDCDKVDQAVTTQRSTVGSISGTYLIADVNNGSQVLTTAIDEA